MVNKVKVEIEVGKETKEVADALKELILDIKAKKDISMIAAENLPSLLKAVEGVDKLDDELKSEVRNSTVAYVGLQISEALLPSEKESA